MLVKAVKTYTDKVARATIGKGTIMDITLERFKELSEAPGAPYVEKFGFESIVPESVELKSAEPPKKK